MTAVCYSSPVFHFCKVYHLFIIIISVSVENIFCVRAWECCAKRNSFVYNTDKCRRRKYEARTQNVKYTYAFTYTLTHTDNVHWKSILLIRLVNKTQTTQRTNSEILLQILRLPSFETRATLKSLRVFYLFRSSALLEATCFTIFLLAQILGFQVHSYVVCNVHTFEWKICRAFSFVCSTGSRWSFKTFYGQSFKPILIFFYGVVLCAVSHLFLCQCKM